jgi:hypothetical protein
MTIAYTDLESKLWKSMSSYELPYWLVYTIDEWEKRDKLVGKSDERTD